VAPEAPGRVAAAVDLGSTSVHLLVARVIDHRLESLLDESVFLGLGDAAQRGTLDGDGLSALVDALAHYAWSARGAGAEAITFVGTEPLRRLANAGQVVAEIEHATGIGLHVLDHDEEGFLTLIGATEGRPIERRLLIVDVGGGSSEFVTIGPAERATAAGVRVGAAGLSARIVAHDPPTATEIEELRRAAGEAIAAAPDAAPDEIVVVGGTASNLLKLVPAARERRTLGRSDLRAAFRIVGNAPAALVAAEHEVKPVRARILGAGAAIVEAILDRYGHEQARVSEWGIREGTVLASLHAGPAWRDRLEELAHGWVR
jgi:exopolyphosphatase/guanosine-5'-triphosphate,3'-diphosphate pyrophosphatase